MLFLFSCASRRIQTRETNSVSSDETAQSSVQAAVFRGSKSKTASGLKKSDLKKSKTGKIVSAKKSNLAKRRYASSKASKWIGAVRKARSALKIKGFAAVGGKSSQGKTLLAKARSFYKK